jgi:hypothetical protein
VSDAGRAPWGRRPTGRERDNVIAITEKPGGVTVFGDGEMGGKGAGIAKVNACYLPQVAKLRTYVLTTAFFDAFVEGNGEWGAEELAVLSSILNQAGDVPVCVRSSATNEAGLGSEGTAQVHAGEHTSFMLPNNHPDHEVRFGQLVKAVYSVYGHFLRSPAFERGEKMGVVINPIPGIFDDTRAGPVYYPYISGIANSFFPYALKGQDPKDGFARIAFGHGYATVLDDFPVISMATISNPLPIDLLRIGAGQQFFYALDMTKNRDLRGEELETMAKLHVTFANFHKIRLLGLHKNQITIEELVRNDHFRFRSGLAEIMARLSSAIDAHFQIEFVFNIDFSKKDREVGTFHIVQLTQLPRLRFEPVRMPEAARRTYLAIHSLQGHGVKRGVRAAVVVSPFGYTKEMHDRVKARISELNGRMRDQGRDYLILVPGRLGSANRDWGLYVDYADVDHASAIFEYGVDVAGRPEPLPEEKDLTGGLYGSHFLYMIQGGADEADKRVQTRMFGTQGTHFLTNLMVGNVIYGYVAPGKDAIDPALFGGDTEGSVPHVFEFPRPVVVYADALSQDCRVIEEDEGR